MEKRLILELFFEAIITEFGIQWNIKGQGKDYVKVVS